MTFVTCVGPLIINCNHIIFIILFHAKIPTCIFVLLYLPFPFLGFRKWLLQIANLVPFCLLLSPANTERTSTRGRGIKSAGGCGITSCVCATLRAPCTAVKNKGMLVRPTIYAILPVELRVGPPPHAHTHTLYFLFGPKRSLTHCRAQRCIRLKNARLPAPSQSTACPYLVVPSARFLIGAWRKPSGLRLTPVCPRAHTSARAFVNFVCWWAAGLAIL